jgi:hypothetical protein
MKYFFQVSVTVALIACLGISRVSAQEETPPAPPAEETPTSRELLDQAFANYRALASYQDKVTIIFHYIYDDVDEKEAEVVMTFVADYYFVAPSSFTVYAPIQELPMHGEMRYNGYLFSFRHLDQWAPLREIKPNEIIYSIGAEVFTTCVMLTHPMNNAHLRQSSSAEQYLKDFNLKLADPPKLVYESGELCWEITTEASKEETEKFILTKNPILFKKQITTRDSIIKNGKKLMFKKSVITFSDIKLNPSIPPETFEPPTHPSEPSSTPKIASETPVAESKPTSEPAPASE